MLARDLGDRTRSVSNRSRKAAEIVHGPDQHDPKTYPQQTRSPSPDLAGQDRPGNRPGGGDGRKVLSEEVKPRRRHVIDPVIALVRRGRARVVERELARHPTAVKTIRSEQRRVGEAEK